LQPDEFSGGEAPTPGELRPAETRLHRGPQGRGSGGSEANPQGLDPAGGRP
jgi:hypothetical protein